MSTRKRPSLKGRGAAIFLADRPEEGRGPRRPNTRTPERQQTRMPANRNPSGESPNASSASSTPASQNGRTPEFGYSGRKEKATFYLPEELVFTLEEIWRDLRVMTRSKVKKSDIVQVAIERAAAEFRKQRASSCLLEELGLSERLNKG